MCRGGGRPEIDYMHKTIMLFGDAKSFVGDLIKELAGARA